MSYKINGVLRQEPMIADLIHDVVPGLHRLPILSTLLGLHRLAAADTLIARF